MAGGQRGEAGEEMAAGSSSRDSSQFLDMERQLYWLVNPLPRTFRRLPSFPPAPASGGQCQAGGATLMVIACLYQSLAALITPLNRGWGPVGLP